ncbi:MAG: hypothetical protein ACPGWR_32505, partial [Ardenticatenaceae bacterium]
MLNLLTAQDPLSDETVIINIQVEPDNKQRSQRTALVTVGISGQVPIMLSGPFGRLNELINQAWRSFGENTTPNTTIASLAVQPKSNQNQTKPKKDSILS